ncbi:radical SAM protein [bacterium]|nr:radical SAM protein [candidate division CSSED10-310 bacterium]
MKVMLINSPWVHDREQYGVKAGARWAHVRPRRKTIPYFPYPFAMAYAASNLMQAGIDTVLLDAVAMEISVSETLNAITQCNPDMIVLETSTPSIESDLHFASMVAKSVDASIVFSGPHATALPEDVLRSSEGRAVLRGEYDITIVELAQAIDDRSSLANILGISWKSGDAVTHNPNRSLITDLDELPYPVRKGLPMERYTDPACKKFPNVSIISSRGCPYRCIFCLESTVFFHTPSFRRRDPQKVVDEMIHVIDNYNAQEIYFDDSSFTASHQHARAVAQAIIDRRLSIAWSCMADARVDFDTLKLMKSSGCTGLKFGVETADEAIMKRINKKLDLNNVRRFAEDCKKLGLYTHGTFMFGLPGETKKSIQKTIDFAFSLDCTTSQFSVATPFPGTAFYEMAKTEGWLVTDDWNAFDGGQSPVVSYPECSRQDIIEGLERAKKRKILQLITHPVVLSQYLYKLYKMKGFWGLMSEIAGKAGYLLERTR